MSINSLPTIVTLLIALSVATERVVEIIKSLVPWLNTEHPSTKTECHRRATIQALAVAAGILVSTLSWPVLARIFSTSSDAAVATVVNPGFNWSLVVAVGFLASGGSGFWNTILSYVMKVKELKQVEVREEKLAISAIPRPGEGNFAA
jgi:hypothetical protein